MSRNVYLDSWFMQRFFLNIRLDSLLESSAERMNSATNSFSIMKLQHSPQNGQSSPLKPAVSPKPGTPAWEKKFISPTSASPYSVTSGMSESAIPGNGSFPLSPVMTKTFQSFSPGPSTPVSLSQSESTETPGSVTAAKKMFMKPSEFLPSSPKSKPKIVGVISHVNPPSPFKSTGNDEGRHEVVQYSYESGPVHTDEQVITTSSGDGTSISLKRIFQQQETTSTSKITSTRKIFQHKHDHSEG